MINIQLNGKSLDTYASETVQISWEGFRFMKGLKAGYTNDIKIPKTENNLSILKAVGLLDSQSQLFGDKTVRGIIQPDTDVRIIPVFIQIASIDKNDIQICIYEDSFPEYMKEKTLRDFFLDSDNTILEWNKYTLNTYPQWFKRYNYGMMYNNNFAQYHPVRRLNDMISAMNFQSGYNMPMVNADWYAMATKKTVCPQNRIQIIEGVCDETTGDFYLSGGQHITNKMDIQHGDGLVEIYFNRTCVVDIDFTIAWHAKSNSYNVPFIVYYNDENGTSSQSFQIRGDLYRNKIDTTSMSFYINNGGKLTFSLIGSQWYESCNFLAELTISNYEITDDDYDNELSYIARRPRLTYYDYNANAYITTEWDGEDYVYSYKERNVSGSKHGFLHTNRRSLSYFGINCNIPNVKICDFWYSMQWMMAKKLDYDHDKTVVWKSIDESAVIEGEILQMRPKSDKLGQKNYFKFQNDDNPLLVSTINNQWLNEEMTLNESKFARVENKGHFIGKINQYSNPEYDAKEDVYKCDFNEIDSLAIWWNVTQQGGMTVLNDYIRDVPIPKLDMDKLVQSVEVDIITFTPQLRDKDIIYIDGRKFFIVSCKTDMDIQKSELTCLLIPKILYENKIQTIQQQNNQNK